MSKENDLTFTFNAEPFMNGIKQVNNGLTKLIKRAAILTAGFLSLRKMFSKIPELGQMFSIAGDVMLRNFLEPLRTWLIPLLQQMMAWVRKNRGLFVKLGAVFANIFRVAYVLIKQFLKLLKVLWDSLSSTLQGVFGKTTKTITELLNMAIFKISVVFIFLGQMLKPVFRRIERLNVSISQLQIPGKHYLLIQVK